MYWGAVDSTGQAKALLQECYAARLALAIALLKALLPDVALLIEQEHARIGHPNAGRVWGRRSGMVLEDTLVEETEGTDDGAALIREESIGDVLFGGKSGQHVHGVVADGKGTMWWRSKSGRLFCSSTSCDLQKGHHPALR